ncbi:uncharacterized protein LAJ45_01878 [Morchella importuna]|uniref:uncharacterized protein n=1 Tax=Morchella importuna TaxID=1174673 RepID=UPI001E8CC946|nr:uncharacterized protein LAJ45_01878 [Morchella importuna]KAH8154111.1 hypothetical protein LAJ45_01878 [Morchella importuna]
MISLQSDLPRNLPNNIPPSTGESHSVTCQQPPRTIKSQNPNAFYSSKDIPAGYEEIGDDEEDTTLSHISTSFQNPGCVYSYKISRALRGAPNLKMQKSQCQCYPPLPPIL